MKTNNFALSPIPNKSGIGLRGPHLKTLSEKPNLVNWVEVHPENYFRFSREQKLLEKAREFYPLSCHGVGLSLGSFEEVSRRHLKHLSEFIKRFEPEFISEHISWNMVEGIHLQDLLPMPYNQASLEAICKNISITQDYLGRQIFIENPSLYLRFENSEMKEYEFISEIINNTKCKILLDLNNLYVNSINHGYNTIEYIENLQSEDIGEIHLAGHKIQKMDNGLEVRIDTHNDFVSKEVWCLYEYFIRKKGNKPTLIEWDQDIPAIEVLIKETQKIDVILDKYKRLQYAS